MEDGGKSRGVRDFSEDKEAIAELQALSPKAKGFLNHHVRNTMTGVILYCTLEKHEEAQQVALQLIEILEVIAPQPDLSAAKAAVLQGGHDGPVNLH